VIDFRYHVVSIVAVFLALAVGLVLGASFLSSEQISLLKTQITGANNAKNSLENDNRALTAANGRLDDYIEQTKRNVVGSQLYSDYVVVVRAAGADQTAASAAVSLAMQASATVTADITVNPAFSDPGNTGQLEVLVDEYTPVGQNVAGADAVTRAMNLLAEALTAQTPRADTVPHANGGGSPSPRPTQTAAAATTMTPDWSLRTLKAFQNLGVIAVNAMPDAATMVKPTAALIVAPDTAGTDVQNGAYVTLAQALHSAGVGPVIGGGSAAAGKGGVISTVLKDAAVAKGISTVDNMDTVTGQVAVVFALFYASTDSSDLAGHYGTTGSTDGLLPRLPTPVPVPSPSVS
jgi:hypothetical protein